MPGYNSNRYDPHDLAGRPAPRDPQVAEGIEGQAAPFPHHLIAVVHAARVIAGVRMKVVTHPFVVDVIEPFTGLGIAISIHQQHGNAVIGADV